MQEKNLSLEYSVKKKPSVDSEVMVMLALGMEFLGLPMVKLKLVNKYSYNVNRCLRC